MYHPFVNKMYNNKCLCYMPPVVCVIRFLPIQTLLTLGLISTGSVLVILRIWKCSNIFHKIIRVHAINTSITSSQETKRTYREINGKRFQKGSMGDTSYKCNCCALQYTRHRSLHVAPYPFGKGNRSNHLIITFSNRLMNSKPKE